MEAIAIGVGMWMPIADGDDRARALHRRHYSARHYRDGRGAAKFVGPGEYMALMTVRCDALFVWRKFIDDSGQKGINCAIFRNEGGLLSSELITEACHLAWLRWPGERLYTYVNAKRVRSRNPGYCFKAAGWQTCGMTKGGLVILDLMPDPGERYGQV